MTIKEFLEKIKNTTDLKEVLEIRTYIPIAEKKVILETILDQCLTVTDGILTCDYIVMEIAFELAMLKYHTNLEIDIASEEDYDELQSLKDMIHCEYLTDYRRCQSLFNGMKQELYTQYSIETSIIQLSNKISSDIGGLVNIVTQKVESFDMSKFGFEGLELDKLKKMLNKYGK